MGNTASFVVMAYHQQKSWIRDQVRQDEDEHIWQDRFLNAIRHMRLLLYDVSVMGLVIIDTSVEQKGFIICIRYHTIIIVYASPTVELIKHNDQ